MEGEIRYKPISVRDLLADLHTTTTLMVDLAYSAVLFNDRELAEEVIELEEKVDDLKTLLLMNTAIVVRDAEDAQAMAGIIRMAAVADRISDAAGEIAHVVTLELGVDPYILEGLAKTQERLVRTKILPESILRGKTLGRLRLETNIGVHVMVVRRGRDVTINPGPKTILREEDIIIARGSDVGISELDRLAKGELKAVPRPKMEVEEKHR